MNLFKQINVLLISTCLLCGCSVIFPRNHKTEQEYTVVLTERQKQILREAGLPTEYSELTVLQADAITKIERALCYAENKYNRTFYYDGYVGGGVDGQYVTATDSDGKYIMISFYYDEENEQYVFSDNYISKSEGDTYKSMIEEQISKYVEPNKYKLFVDLEKKSEDNDIFKAYNASIFVFILDDSYDAYEDLMTNLGEWLQHRCIGRSVWIKYILTENNQFMQIFDLTYDDYVYQNNRGFRLYSISKDGKVTISEREETND